MSARFVKPKEAEKTFGVHRRTLRKWADDGHIRSFRPGGTGQTLYDVSTAVDTATPRPPVPSCEGGEQSSTDDAAAGGGGGLAPQLDAVYARVSTRKQSGDLERQLGSLRDAHPNAAVFSDVASGLNFKRKGLRALLKLAFEGKLRRVHVAHKDRLCRFAFDIVEYTLAQHGAVVVVDDDGSQDGSDEQDLAQDVLSVITVFGARLHGKRSGQGRKRRREESEASEDGASGAGGAGGSSDEAAGAVVRAAPPGPLR